MIPKEFREKFAQAKEELTRSPQVNELIKICKDLEEGKAEAEVLKGQLDVLYDVHEALVVAYEALAPTQPRTETFATKGKKMKAAFDELKEGLDEISLYLEDQDVEHLHTGLESVRTAIDTITDASDALKKDEEAVEILSHSPPVNELLRIGKGFLAGEFERVDMVRRYEVVESLYAETFSNIEKISQMPPDTKAMEEQLPIIKEALKMFREGLDDLKEYVAAGEKKPEEEAQEEAQEAEEDLNLNELLKGGLDKVQEASKRIYESQLAIKEGIDKAMEEDAKKTEWQAKFMGKTAPGSDVGGGLDIKVGETPAQPPPEEELPQLLVPPNYKKVYDAAWAVSKDEISTDEFLKTVEWLAGTVKKNMADLPKLIKPENLSEAEEKLFDDSKKTLVDGMENTLSGLEEMKKYLDDKDVSHLETGLNTIMLAGDMLYKIQVIGDEVSKKMQEAKKKK
jgi:hypothetical protein